MRGDHDMMRWPQELHFLLPLERIYRREGVLRIAVWAAIAVLAANSLLNLAAAWMPLAVPWRAGISLAAGLAAVFHLVRRRPGLPEISRRMDRELHSQERIQTFLEMRAQSSAGLTGEAEREEGMAGLLLAELKRYFRSRPPGAAFNWRSFRPLAAVLVLALLLFAATLAAAPVVSGTLASGQEIREARAEALESLEELEQLLPPDPLLLELIAELEALTELINLSADPREMELLLREALELLEKQREELKETAAALERLQELLEGMTAPEAAALLEEDLIFRRELQEQLGRLIQTLPPGETRTALREVARGLEGAAGNELSRAMDALFENLDLIDPAAAARAMQAGAERLRENQEFAAGRPGGESGPNGAGNGSRDGSSGSSGTHGSGNNPHGGGSSGEGSTGEGSGSAGEGGGGGGQSSVGESGGGNTAGSGGSGGGGGESGGGAGTGSASPRQHDFFFIPGEQEIFLGGEGEEGLYTLQDILRFNPGLSPDNYAEQIRCYYRQGTASLQGGHIPVPLQSYVREYFEAIAP